MSDTKKSVKDTAIIYSYHRSGLHLLALGLYMLDGGNVDLSWGEIWASNKVPSYTHDSPRHSWGPVDGQWWVGTPYNRHILLLRNPCSHYSSVEPDWHKDPLSAFPGGRNAWEVNRYAQIIKQFDRIPNRTFRQGPDAWNQIMHVSLKKMVVYYEDLVQDKKTLLEVADFVGIKYDTVGHQPGLVDFDFIRQNSKRLYLEEGHVSSNKLVLKRKEKKKLLDEVKDAIGDDEIFDRYLKRYTLDKYPHAGAGIRVQF